MNELESVSGGRTWSESLTYNTLLAASWAGCAAVGMGVVSACSSNTGAPVVVAGGIFVGGFFSSQLNAYSWELSQRERDNRSKRV